MDTAKDARILVLEDALRRLHEIVNNRKLKFHIDYSKLGESLKTAGSLMYEVKYSYTPAKQLAEIEPTINLIDAISNFNSQYTEAVKSTSFSPKTSKEQHILAEVRYALRIAEGFKEKLTDFDEDPAFAIDILAVQVTQIQAVEGSDKLTVCRCTDGSRIWPIVTNLQDVKKDAILACGILPPVDMMGVVSEAMFLGGEPLPETIELGPLKEIPPSALDQARAQVMQITKRMT